MEMFWRKNTWINRQPGTTGRFSFVYLENKFGSTLDFSLSLGVKHKQYCTDVASISSFKQMEWSNMIIVPFTVPITVLTTFSNLIRSLSSLILMKQPSGSYTSSMYRETY